MNKFHRKDSILDGLTFEELITAVQCNCKEYSTENILNELKNIMKAQVNDARTLMITHIDDIKRELKH